MNKLESQKLLHEIHKRMSEGNKECKHCNEASNIEYCDNCQAPVCWHCAVISLCGEYVICQDCNKDPAPSYEPDDSFFIDQ